MKKVFSLAALALTALVCLVSCEPKTETTTFPAEGYWYSAQMDMGMLVCPSNHYKDVPAILTHKELEYDDSWSETGEVSRLCYDVDATTGKQNTTSGHIYDSEDDLPGSVEIRFTIAGDEMTCTAEGEPSSIVLKKQPAKAQQAAKDFSLDGEWKLSYTMGGVDIALVLTKQSATMTVTDPTGATMSDAETFDAYYYSPVAGVGALVFSEEEPDGYERVSPLRRLLKKTPAAPLEPVEGLGQTALLFEVLSADKIQLKAYNPEFGIDLILQKQ